MTDNKTSADAPAASGTDAGTTPDGTKPEVKAAEPAAPNAQQVDGDGKTPATEGAGNPATDPSKEPAKTEGDDATKDADKKPVVPEKYADFTLPEGVQADTETMDKFTALAKKHGLSQEAAQEFAELGGNIVNKTVMKPGELLKEATNKWAEETKADKELGGDEAVIGEKLSVAKKALDAFASPELKLMLGKFDPSGKDGNPKGTGLGNHPEIIRFFYHVGKAISEDNKIVTGTTSVATNRDPAAILYGTKN